MITGLTDRFHGIAHAQSSGSPSVTAHHRETRVGEVIFEHIALYVGPVTAGAALDAACQASGCDPVSKDPHDVPKVLAALRPMIGTLLGAASSRMLFLRIERELRSL
jgi:hypothetical protein